MNLVEDRGGVERAPPCVGTNPVRGPGGEVIDAQRDPEVADRRCIEAPNPHPCAMSVLDEPVEAGQVASRRPAP